jgi:drug/metabolite transporter (DMT)-like permease
MGFLLASILCATFIFLVFKGFERFSINTRYGIIVNYLSAALVGVLLYPGQFNAHTLFNPSWIWHSIALGLLFIFTFNLIALTSQKMGVSAASVATKMSLIIPVILAVILHGEQLDAFNIIGVITALAAVFLASQKPAQQLKNNSSIILPLAVFVCSGIIDASLNFMGESYVANDDYPLFSSGIFTSAAIFGALYEVLKKGEIKKTPSFKDLAGGIMLGVPNFFAVYFLMKALQVNDLSSASVFTLNNVSVVLLTTLLGILFFKERLTAKNWIGVLLAVCSILLVTVL